MTIVFVANRPGAWLREDIGNVLTSLTIRHSEPEYLEALRAVALALGLDERPGNVAQHYGRLSPYSVVSNVLAEVIP